MTTDEQQHKLSMIRTLSDKELRGYWLYVVTRELRPAFDGERAALLDRAQVLGITLGDA